MADHLATTQTAAVERAWRTFKQGLGLDILVAVAVVLGAWLPDGDITDGQQWYLIGLAVAKTILQTVVAYVMRLKVLPQEEVANAPGAADIGGR